MISAEFDSIELDECVIKVGRPRAGAVVNKRGSNAIVFVFPEDEEQKKQEQTPLID